MKSNSESNSKMSRQKEESNQEEELRTLEELGVPPQIIDPINETIYCDPISAADGHLYEKETAIEFARKNDYQTVHRVPAMGTSLNPVLWIKNAADDFLKKNPQFKKYQYKPKKDYRDYKIFGQSRMARNKDQNVSNSPINEASPLVAQVPRQCGCVAFCVGTTAVALIFVGGIIALVVLLDKPNNDASKLAWDFKTPYAGGGTITIWNNFKYIKSVSAIQFSVNSVIDTQKQGTIYGDLAPWGKSNIELLSTNGNQFNYQINEDKLISLNPKAKLDFTYVFSSAKGALNVSAMPENVKIIDAKGAVYDIPLLGTCTSASDCPDPLPGKFLGGYYTSWDMYQRQYDVTSIPVKNINFVNYAFLMPDVDGNIASHDPNSDNIQLPMLTQMTYKFPYLKVSFSVGGYGPPCSAFTSLAANPTARQNFATQVLSAIQQFKYHGVDVDWEYPGDRDAINFVKLLQTLRNTLGNNYRITIAAPAGADNIHAIGDLWANVTQYVDAINIMFYDYNGPWSMYSDYQSAMSLPVNDPNGIQYSVTYTLSLYKQHGVPNNKIVFGIPAYYRGVLVSRMDQLGLWQPVNGTPQGQFDPMGTFDYSCVIGSNCYNGTSLPKTCNYVSENNTPYGNFSHTPLITCPQIYFDKRNAIFTGDSVKSVQYKTCVTTTNNYQGIFFWTLSGDVRNNASQSLVTTALNGLKTPCTNTSETHNQGFLVHDLVSWEEFTSQVKQTVLASFIGGFAFSFVFTAVDKLTDYLLANVFKKVHFKELEYNMAAYYSVKTALYLGALYYIGLPLLPAAAGKVITNYFHHMCEIPKGKSALAGGIASFLMNLDYESLSLEKFCLAVVSFVTSMLGGFTVLGAQYSASMLQGNRVFGFFGSRHRADQSNNADPLIQKGLTA